MLEKAISKLNKTDTETINCGHSSRQHVNRQLQYQQSHLYERAAGIAIKKFMGIHYLVKLKTCFEN